jgi:protein KRI1
VEAKHGKTSALGKRKQNDDEEDDPEDEEESSESEDEDEEGELVTEALDSEIHATLNAIRSKDPRVYDPNVKFYSELKEDKGTDNQEKKEKPMYLRDYHRQNLLSGANINEDEETPKTFAQEQEELKRTVVQEMHAAAEDNDSDDEDMDDEGGFLIPKSTQVPEDSRPEVQLDVEQADKDPEKFLSDFMSARAWIPSKSSRFQAFESDDEEEEAVAEAFEEAYNFRFEDPNKVNEKILTHARDTIKQISVRREEMSSRKKRREAERLKKEEEKKQRESEKNRLRKLKMEELEEKIKKIKQAAGIKAADITDEEWMRLLDENWDDEKWEKEMQKRFGEEYYAQQEEDLSGDDADGKKEKLPKKPTWDDDIDIKDLVPDFEEEEKVEVSQSDGDMEDDEDGTTGSKSKKQDRRDKKRAARKELRLIEEAVERNLELDPTLLPGATKKNSSRFRYRETSPQSFGLNAKDILMADDAQLNEFVGLKKLAAFRDPEKKRRDQKKLGKKARLRQWRKDVFGNEEGPKLELPVNGDAAGPKDDQGDEMTVDIREGGSRKKRKRSKKH